MVLISGRAYRTEGGGGAITVTEKGGTVVGLRGRSGILASEGEAVAGGDC